MRKLSKEREMEAKMISVITEYQTTTTLTTPALASRPVAREQRLWDVGAIVAYCKVQRRLPELLRMKDKLLQSCVELAIVSMKRDGAAVRPAAGDEEGDDGDDDGDEGDDAADGDSARGQTPGLDVDSILEEPITAPNHLNRSLLNVYSRKSNIVTPSVPTLTKAAGGPTSDVPGSSTPALEQASVAAPPLTKKRPNASSGVRSESKKAKLSPEQKYAPPKARLADLGGIEKCIEEVQQLISMPLRHPEIYLHLGIQPPRGILLHGPPGCGKTALANAIAGEAGVPFINISAPSVVSGMSGESEKKIRDVFDEAKELAPCIIFIDEIDAITPKRETAQREMERRIVAQLLTCMDDLSLERTNWKPVILIGATNRPDSLDPALRRAGRFDREIAIGVPDEAARARILERMCAKMRLEGDFNFPRLAKLTPGYVGADLGALTAEAGLIAVKRIFHTLEEKPSVRVAADGAPDSNDADGNILAAQPMDIDDGNLAAHELAVTNFLNTRSETLTDEELRPLCITQEDFQQALAKVQPSSKREGFATVPDVTWDDVGALSSIRDELRMAIVEPIKRPEFFVRVGIVKPMGVLLYGPPGCGKTLLAKAVANESCCNFISVKGPELLNKYVGESERGVRQVFARAAASSPCVIFFDELDALCPARSNESENQSSSRLVNTLLTELDGMQTRAQVYIIAATNRPDMIDPAMLRPGRLDKTLYVDLPSQSERAEILKTISRKTPLGPQVNLEQISADPRSEGFSGADLAALVREAAVAALRSTLYAPGGFVDAAEANGDSELTDSSEIWINNEHFDVAFKTLAPSVSKRDRRRYELLRVKMSNQ